MPVQIYNKRKGGGARGGSVNPEQRKHLEDSFIVPVFVSKDYVSFNLKNIFIEIYLIDLTYI